MFFPRPRSVRIQFMSDLHLEQVGYKFALGDPAASILLLVGDIGRLSDYAGYRCFMLQCCAAYDKVLLVAGNSEFYGTSHDQGLQLLHQLTQDPAVQGKLQLLNRSRYDVPGSEVTILGCTLYSHIRNDLGLTKNFRHIDQWTVEQHNAKHKADLDWLLREVSRLGSEKRVVVATYYAPLQKKVSHPAHEGNEYSQCFVSNALDIVRRVGQSCTITHWIFGRTHWNVRFKYLDIIVQSNQVHTESGRLTRWQKIFLYRPFDPRATIKVRE
ncbi:hypothetical protein K470DRAFT_129835 [Piedraia hortae CBS 480.64]|uniref:Calcineurin-like phosphoesterase domain-containing protein n=1 Tax=Piedraia hortae CBS 480.64 TaxID=1314780 RepID=A0A6A7BU56_9PEZI|nr:hypothetical protein K470DRAFT_129835 [Piedraia hortae CBS 480.64]